MNLRSPVWATVLLASTAACSPSSEPESGPGTSTQIDAALVRESSASDSLVLARLIADGLEVYKGQYCGVCHELDRAESVATSGPTHNALGTMAAQRIGETGYAGEATTAEAYLRESIVAPMAYIVPGYEHTRYRMPAYTNISEQEVDALVHMLLKEK